MDDVEQVVFNSPITEEEILKSVKSMKESKSAGLDNLPPGIFIHCIDIIIPLVKRFFNRLLDLGEFPEDWGLSFIVPVHKKGDINCVENYRGISLLDIFGKIYTSIINRRLIFVTNLYSIISEAQAGFRNGYSTIDNLFILQGVISKYLSKRHGKLYVGFVDFKAAFDSVHRDKLWLSLNHYGVKGKLLSSIKAVYRSVKACVKVNSTLTEFFDCHVGLRQGCMISPVLFSLFINEFTELIEQSGLRGIQLYPDLVELFLLLFADDVALLSDSVIGLQRQLNLLYDFCKDKKLQVNIRKTKVVVFKNGPMLARNEKWTFDGQRLDVVNCFSYLGLSLSMQLSFNRMASDQATKAKRVLISLLNSLYDLGQLPKDIFFKIFDRKISPLLLYGSEIWGCLKRESVELVHRYACKRYMCVSLKACNAAVLGDCGRFPLWIESNKRCIKYWLKILNMPDTRYVKKCYTMLKVLDEYGQNNWVSQVRQLLFSNGFGYIWINQHVLNPRLFILAFVQRLRDQYLQAWYNELANSSKLCLYKSYKLSYEHEMYLSSLNIRKFRHTLSMFRTSSHSLEIEVGRHHGRPRNERFCKLCKTGVEDEAHMLLYCPVYDSLRQKYLSPKYCNLPNMNKFNILMSSRSETSIHAVAAYLYYAFKLRQELLDT
ncbi:MAG: reverse transcriptase family protein [Candidatus Thiodiazotropha sp.]